MPVLDTNYLIALHAGDKGAVRLLERHREDELIIPDLVAAEFLTDWPDPADREKVLAALAQDFTLCWPDLDWIRTAAALRVELRARRALVRKTDVWIAVWARYRQTPVITRDAGDFGKMGVDVLSW